MFDIADLHGSAEARYSPLHLRDYQGFLLRGKKGGPWVLGTPKGPPFGTPFRRAGVPNSREGSPFDRVFWGGLAEVFSELH